ncbi:EF-hand domain-containing protein [Methylotenera sp.]|uniref:EF-hand domain-containing protein n=1 Tax=Methylotenera sp. TaxID=2051956 RepID=UPI00273017F8|nr:EF-hand domain-containing protein [Methylotenera sp.]MDP1522751.1 EF-hand domain-containing protein [Methylotenera sp.]MDP2230984.1 EF-hand domain-containing protein [Methylotenera sp.]MDP3141339.1 EF-hand domain-containing protein [Methylotenera sp.]MDP3819682.1 EF-hand domain-containing protein [Methylotenera sp.]
MKFNLNLITTNVIAAFFLAGLSSAALADNKAAFKNAIGNENKIAEVKTGEIKAIDSTAKLPVDADFKKLDTNGNTKISLKEAVKDKDLSLYFDATDANKDGNISAEEFASYKASKSLSAVPASAPVAEPAPAN